MMEGWGLGPQCHYLQGRFGDLRLMEFGSAMGALGPLVGNCLVGSTYFNNCGMPCEAQRSLMTCPGAQSTLKTWTRIQISGYSCLSAVPGGTKVSGE